MESGLMQNHELINGRQVVKKHVATIHCSNKLSLLELKISNALLFHAFPNLKQELAHQIRVDELKRLICVNTRNHQALKNALKKLISTVMEWNLLGDNVPELDMEGWNASTILSSVSVTKGVIKYQYSELIKTLIIDPKIYGKINLIIQARFKSSYALALYENCSRYRGLSYTKNIDISVFRKLMGVEDGKYEIFRDFNRRVLNAAISEINTCSDIRITPEITRAGKMVKSIKFKIEERSIKRRIGMLSDSQKENSINNNSEKNAMEKFVKEYGEEKVKRAVEYVQSRPAYKNGEIKNVSGYIKSAITNSYEEKNKVELTEEQKEEINFRTYRFDYYQFITDHIMQQFATVSEEGQHKAVSNFFTSGNKIVDNFAHNENLLSSSYDKLGSTVDGLRLGIQSKNENAVVFFEKGFSEFLYKKYKNVKENAPSFKEFMMQQKVNA